jgi:hypothetical protein
MTLDGPMAAIKSGCERHQLRRNNEGAARLAGSQ